MISWMPIVLIAIFIGLIFLFFHFYSGPENEDNIRRGLVKYSSIYAVILITGLSFGSHLYNQERESQIESFYSGYKEGWSNGCSDMMNHFVEKDIMYANGKQFTTSWCMQQYEEDTSYFESTTEGFDNDYYYERGKEFGFSRAVDEVFTHTDYLCYGVDCLSKDYYFSF